jgi:ATP-dependent helicase/nuclease subunit A
MNMNVTSPATVQAHSNDPSAQQRVASDPNISSWVGASAGSGKTKVLTDRMLRLLLPREDGRPGTRPEKILALTFTKTAANEMSLRLAKRLSEWTVMSDEKLKADISEKLLGRDPTELEMDAARTLFARIVDVPGGLKIMTIHSFCQSILGRFPIEAGIAPHFKPLEEAQANELLKQAADSVLTQAQNENGTPLARALKTIAPLVNQEQFLSLVKTMSGERRQIENMLIRTGGDKGLYDKLCALLGVGPGITEESLWEGFCHTPLEADLRAVCPALAASKSSTDQGKADDIQSFWDADTASKRSYYTAYKQVFLTTKNTIKLPTKAVLGTDEGVQRTFEYEANRILAYEETYKALLCASLTRDAFLLGAQILSHYKELKVQQGVLDFDDLIFKTLSLLKNEIETMGGLDVAPWVLYKLDEGLDHILVDEAQDTNPEQWDIIKSLSEEFFAGIGAKDDITRTMFVVGDEKQSIFSFQRAAPEKFGDMFNWFNQIITESGEDFVPVNIRTSFRSVQTILDAVDSVFTQDHTIVGLSGEYLNHIAYRTGQAGLVELWPLLESQNSSKDDDSADEDDGWDLPTNLVESRSGAQQMAERIGDTIKGWLDNNEILHSYNRTIHPGDIMVLVKSRNRFVSQLVRELKRRNIAVSGVDRMVLSDQLVVQDLCSAAAFALMPDDDLTLAELLKSPMLGINENQLYALAQPRTGSLWAAVRKQAHKDVTDWLSRLIERAGEDRPYEFLSRIVQEPCPADSISGLRAIKHRLGEDALDPLDEFLNAALAFEGSHTPSLQGFLKWHERGETEIKRQMEEAGRAVRIMTVHGAKGLQAPIVFLPDTVRVGANTRSERLLWPHKTGLDLPLYVPSKDLAPDIALQSMRHIQQKEDEEYRRLLYVAMTRAEERLYIGGYTGKRQPSDKADAVFWYKDIRSAFEKVESVQRIPWDDKASEESDPYLLRWETRATNPADKTKETHQTKDEVTHELPSYFSKRAPEEPFPPQPLVPSKPSDPEPGTASPLSLGKDKNRFKRGNITHKLLQILPDIKTELRREAAQKFLKRSSLELEPTMQDSILDEVMRILEDPTFGAIFGPGSLAEIPVTGLLDNKILISGQVDRLFVTEQEILIVDFKTNRPPPMKAGDVPPIYQKQMQAYAKALQEIYGDRPVRCALLWTDGARLMELPV